MAVQAEIALEKTYTKADISSILADMSSLLRLVENRSEARPVQQPTLKSILFKPTSVTSYRSPSPTRLLAVPPSASQQRLSAGNSRLSPA